MLPGDRWAPSHDVADSEVADLRAENSRHRDVIERAAARLAAVYSEDGPTGTPDEIDEAIGETLLILGEITAEEPDTASRAMNEEPGNG